MTTVGIKAAAYCLNFAPELALHYGGTPAQERRSKPDSEFLRELNLRDWAVRRPPRELARCPLSFDVRP